MTTPPSPASSLGKPLFASAFQRPTFGTLRGRKVNVTQPCFFPLPDRARDIDSYSYNIASRMIGLAGYALFGITDKALETAHSLAGKIKGAIPEAHSLTESLLQAHMQEVEHDTHSVATAAGGAASYIPFVGGFLSTGVHTADSVAQANLQAVQREAGMVARVLKATGQASGSALQFLIGLIRKTTSGPREYFEEVIANPDKLGSDLGSVGDWIFSRGYNLFDSIILRSYLRSCMIPFPLPENVSQGELELFFRATKNEKLRFFDMLRSRVETQNRILPATLDAWQEAIHTVHQKTATSEQKQAARKTLTDMMCFSQDLRSDAPLPLIDRLPFATAEELLDDDSPLQERKEKLASLVQRLDACVTSHSTTLSQRDLDSFKREVLPHFSVATPFPEGIGDALALFLEKAEKELLEVEFATCMERADRIELWKKMLFSVASSSHWKLSAAERAELDKSIETLASGESGIEQTNRKLKTLYVMYQMIPDMEKKSFVTPEEFQKLDESKKVRLFRLINMHATDLSSEEKCILSTYAHMRSAADWREVDPTDQETLSEIICRHFNHLPQEKVKYAKTIHIDQVRMLSAPAKKRLFSDIQQVAAETHNERLCSICEAYQSPEKDISIALFDLLPPKVQRRIRRLVSVEDDSDIRTIVERWNAQSPQVKEDMLEYSMIKLSRDALDMGSHLRFQRQFQAMEEFAKIDTETLEATLIALTKEEHSVSPTSPEKEEIQCNIELVLNLLKERKLPAFQRETVLIDPLHLPTQVAEEPASISPRSLEQALGAHVVSQGFFHKTGEIAGRGAAAVVSEAGEFVSAPITLPTLPGIDRLFDAGWHIAADLIEQGVGVETATGYLSRFASFQKVESLMENSIDKLINLPLSLSSHLSNWIQHIRNLKQLPGQELNVQRAISETEHKLLTLQTRWKSLCPVGEGAQQKADILCSEEGMRLLQETKSTLLELRGKVLSPSGAPVSDCIQRSRQQQEALKTLFRKSEPGILAQVQESTKGFLGRFAFWNSRVPRPAAQTDAPELRQRVLEMQKAYIETASHEVEESEALARLREFQQSGPWLHRLAQGSLTAARYVPYIGHALFSDASLSMLDTAVTGLNAVLKSSAVLYQGSRWITRAKHKAIQKTQDFVDRSLTDVDTYTQETAIQKSGSGWAKKLMSYLAPGILTAVAGTPLTLTSVVIRKGLPSLMRKIGPQNIRKLLAGTSGAVQKSFRTGGEYARFGIQGIFDSLQARWNSYRNCIDPTRVDKLSHLTRESRLHLMQMIANSPTVKRRASSDPRIQQALDAVQNRENQQHFLDSLGVWTPTDWNQFCTHLLLCYNAVADEEKTNLTPSVFESLPRHIQNRIRALVKGEGRSHRNDLPWLVTHFNALSREEKTKVHSPSVNEFWQLDSSIQEDLFAILSTCSLSAEIPGRTAYQRYLYCKTLSRQQLRQVLDLYPRVRQSDLAILTPSQIRRMSFGKIDHVLEILERYSSPSISALREMSGNLSWCRNFSTLREKLKSQSDILAQAEREGVLPWEVRPQWLTPQEIKMRERILEHVAILFSSLRVTERQSILSMTNEEILWMTQKEQLSFISSFLLNLKELERRLHNSTDIKARQRAEQLFGVRYAASLRDQILFLEGCAAKLAPSPLEEGTHTEAVAGLSLSEKNELLQLFNGMHPSLQSEIRTAVELNEDLLKKQARMMLDDIHTIDSLYKACQQDLLRVTLSAGHFLNEALRLSKKLKDRSLSSKSREEIEREVAKLQQAKERRIRERESFQQVLNQLEAKRRVKTGLMELAGERAPSLAWARDISEQHLEVVRVFVGETKRAIAHASSEALKDSLDSQQTLRERLTYAHDRLSENSDSIAFTERERQELMGKTTLLTDLSPADRYLLSFYTDKVLCRAQYDAKETFEHTRRNFLEECAQSLAKAAASEHISYETFAAQFNGTMKGILQEEEKKAFLDSFSLFLMEQRPPVSLYSFARNSKNKTSQDIRAEIQTSLTEYSDKLDVDIHTTQRVLLKKTPSYQALRSQADHTLALLHRQKQEIEQLRRSLDKEETEQMIQLSLIERRLPSSPAFSIAEDVATATCELEIEDMQQALFSSLENEIGSIEIEEKKILELSLIPRERAQVALTVANKKRELQEEKTRVNTTLQKRKSDMHPKTFLGWIGSFFRNIWYRIRFRAKKKIDCAQKFAFTHSL